MRIDSNGWKNIFYHNADIFSSAAIVFGGGQVCISRQEDCGVMNIRPAEITANGKPISWINGGENKCVDIQPGQYALVAQSSDPYDPNDNKPDTWKSKPLLVMVKNNKKVKLVVSPISSKKGYVGPWLLRER
jgi:hypothetical protein